MTAATRDAWLEIHEYLRPVAELCAAVDRAVRDVPGAAAEPPRFEAYREEFAAGVPLLRSARVAPDLQPAGAMAAALARRLASEAPAGRFKDDAAALDATLRADLAAPRKIAAFLLGEEAWTPPSAGLLRYLGWAATARFLRPVVEAFESWRDDERWLRSYCPTCGSAPAMAHLAEADQARSRRLCCGRCATRWQYPRTRCPFCEEDSQQLAVVAVEGEGGLRLDYCPSCRGYLKTYAGKGAEALLLADWTSLHLDVIARDRGLERRAASLYDLGLAPTA